MNRPVLTRREFLQSMVAATLAFPEDAQRWQGVVTFLAGEQAAGTFPGAALIASKQGKVLFERCLGTYCSLTRRDAPLDRAVLHPFFSFSKLVSATVVVMAHQAGRIEYDVP